MATFSDIVQGIHVDGTPVAPGRTLVLPVSVFASEWSRRPTEPVCVGLRLLADNDEQQARQQAVRDAQLQHAGDTEATIAAYNDALIRQAVARALCDPNDVKRPHELFPLAEDQVAYALTSAGCRFIFDEIERYQIEVSPIFDEATDEDVKALAARLVAGELGRMPTANNKRAKRLLRFVLSDLELFDPD